jgi:hypothetical protein
VAENSAKKLEIMAGKLLKDDPRELFLTRLANLISPQHGLALLSNAIDWNRFENEFKGFYSDKPSRPAMPIRLLVCLQRAASRRRSWQAGKTGIPSPPKKSDTNYRKQKKRKPFRTGSGTYPYKYKKSKENKMLYFNRL